MYFAGLKKENNNCNCTEINLVPIVIYFDDFRLDPQVRIQEYIAPCWSDWKSRLDLPHRVKVKVLCQSPICPPTIEVRYK